MAVSDMMETQPSDLEEEMLESTTTIYRHTQEVVEQTNNEVQEMELTNS